KRAQNQGRKKAAGGPSASARKKRRFYRNSFDVRPSNAAYITQFKRIGVDTGGAFESFKIAVETDVSSTSGSGSTFEAGALAGMSFGAVGVGVGAKYASLSATIRSE